MASSSSSTSLCRFYTYETSFFMVASLLQASPSPTTLRKARELHALILTSTPTPSRPFLHNTMLSLYSSHGAIAEARLVFDTMPQRTLVSYNSMVSSYSRSPRYHPAAIRLYLAMRIDGFQPNASTLSSLVSASMYLSNPCAGESLHCQAIAFGFVNDVFLQTALLGFYSRHGFLGAANHVFQEMVDRDIVAWNTIIRCNIKNGSAKRGLKLYEVMTRTGMAPDNYTFSIVLNGCGNASDWIRGRIVHAQMIKAEFFIDKQSQNALLDMYSSCGDLATASAVFDRIEKPDLVSWNSVLAGCSDNGYGERAMDVFVKLRAMSRSGGPCPDDYTFAAVVSATAELPYLYYGRPLHAQVTKVGLEQSTFVGDTLIGMYFKNDDAGSAQMLFISMPEKDVITWTEMIVGHSRLGEGELAIKYFYNMREEGHDVDRFSLSSALNSSADLVALRQGEIIHAQVVKTGHGESMSICGSLVNMYAKNGSLEAAWSVFSRTLKPDLICWNSMIGGYGNYGNAEKAFELFNEMVKQRLEPDHVTYVSLLSACSHSGLVERGRFYWFCMLSDGIRPGIKHYTCMANLLSRAGLLQEAEDLIMKSSFSNNSPELWRILLSSCVTFRNLTMGIHAAEKVLLLEPDDSPTHVLLSNLYASVGRWDAVAETRKKIRASMLEKEPGLSWIEVTNVFHTFSSGDETHLQIDNCRNELLRLQGNLKGLEMSEPLLECSI